MISFQLGCITQIGWLNSRQNCVFSSLYIIVKQVFTPPHPHLTFITWQSWEVMLVSDIALHDGAEKEKITRYGDTTHRLCRTTKHIFWLGKNNFIVLGFAV